jgi:hypothetical protein
LTATIVFETVIFRQNERMKTADEKKEPAISFLYNVRSIGDFCDPPRAGDGSLR